MMQSLGRKYVGYINTVYQRSGTLWEGRYKSMQKRINTLLRPLEKMIEGLDKRITFNHISMQIPTAVTCLVALAWLSGC